MQYFINAVMKVNEANSRFAIIFYIQYHNGKCSIMCIRKFVNIHSTFVALVVERNFHTFMRASYQLMRPLSLIHLNITSNNQ